MIRRAPGGGGKVPVSPGYVVYHDKEKVVLRNYEGRIFEYPEKPGDTSAVVRPEAILEY